MIKKRHKGLLGALSGRQGLDYEFKHGSVEKRYHGMLKPDGVTTTGIPNERYTVGIGYIAIPSNIERVDFVSKCLRTGKVGMFVEEAGDYLWDIPIDKSKLQEIDFPEKYGELGSAVVFVNLPKHNTPIIIGVLNKADEAQDYEENKKTIRRETESSYAEISVDGRGNIFTSVQNEDAGSTASVYELIGSRGNDAKIISRIYGTRDVDHYGTFKYRVTDEIVFQIDDPEIDEEITTLKYKKGEGFTYEDEFGNFIKIRDEKMTIESPEILHGENAKEPAVLGDTLEGLLGDLIDAINAITVPTGVGPSGVPVNAAQFSAIKARLVEFKSQKNKIE